MQYSPSRSVPVGRHVLQTAMWKSSVTMQPSVDRSRNRVNARRYSMDSGSIHSGSISSTASSWDTSWSRSMGVQLDSRLLPQSWVKKLQRSKMSSNPISCRSASSSERQEEGRSHWRERNTLKNLNLTISPKHNTQLYEKIFYPFDDSGSSFALNYDNFQYTLWGILSWAKAMDVAIFNGWISMEYPVNFWNQQSPLSNIHIWRIRIESCHSVWTMNYFRTNLREVI